MSLQTTPAADYDGQLANNEQQMRAISEQIAELEKLRDEKLSALEAEVSAAQQSLADSEYLRRLGRFNAAENAVSEFQSQISEELMQAKNRLAALENGRRDMLMAKNRAEAKALRNDRQSGKL